ncbi:serine/threonine protein kinase [Xanthomonas phage SB4]|uniref:Serine/threonine protein kinase n=1 Tax=Xanthomonas phage SB4 TaxID=3117473 RepID=A0ABZ2GUN9_9CAUD
MSKYRELSRRLMRLTKDGKWQHGLRYRKDQHWYHSSGDDDDKCPAFMIEGGFRYVGNGAYTWVFTHWRAPGVVFKVTDDNSDGMLEVSEAFKHIGHKNMPVVHEIHRHDTLIPATYWTEEDTKTFHWVTPGEERSREHVESYGVVVCEVLRDHHPTLNKWAEYRDVRDEVEALLIPHGIELTDMHDGNMMWRGDTIIINDPTTWVRK